MGAARPRRWLSVGIAAVLLAGCRAGKDARSPAVGAAAPDFIAQDLEGKPTALTQLRGKVVVLNEWATWCGPCRGEIPQLEALHRQFAARGVAIVGVSEDSFGTGADVRDFVREHNMTYSVWLDPDKRFAVQFLAIGVPSTVVIDRAGVIRWRLIGALSDGDTTLASAIKHVLGP